jgi:hypothetical protein
MIPSYVWAEYKGALVIKGFRELPPGTLALIVSPDLVCKISDNEANTVVYDFCEVEASIYRSMFELSDTNSGSGNRDGILEYDELLTYLEEWDIGNVEMWVEMYEMMDLDGCGWVTWEEVSEFYGNMPGRMKSARLDILIYLDMLSN